MNLDMTVEEEEQLASRVVVKETICPHPFCGLKGHKTTRSKHCKANPENLRRDKTEAACAEAILKASGMIKMEDPIESGASLEALDLNQHEGVPLIDADDSSIEMYEEANMWSKDEDGNLLDNNGAWI